MIDTTFLGICKWVRREGGMTGTGPAAVTSQVGESARIVEWVRDSDTEIQKLHTNWAFLWSEKTIALSVAGGATYSLPTGAARLDDDGIWIGTTRLIETTYNAMRQYSAATDEPTEFAYLPNRTQIKFYPTPDANYTATTGTFLKPVPMTLAAEESLIPAEYREVIGWFALMKYAAYENAPEVMAKAEKEFTQMITEMRSEYLPEHNAAVGMGRDTSELRVQAV